MAPKAGIGIANGDRADGPPRPSHVGRTLELVGLILLGFGLASMTLWAALAGAGLVIGSYWFYRRKHGLPDGRLPGQGGSAGDGGDGGGD